MRGRKNTQPDSAWSTRKHTKDRYQTLQSLRTGAESADFTEIGFVDFNPGYACISGIVGANINMRIPEAIDNKPSSKNNHCHANSPRLLSSAYGAAATKGDTI